MIALAVLCSGQNTSASAGRSDPSANLDPCPVLQQFRTASGGAAWNNVHTLHFQMKLAAGGREGAFDSWEDVSTGRFAHEVDLPPQTRADGYDGISVWTKPPTGIAYILGDQDARLGANDESFRIARGWWFPDRRPFTCEIAAARNEGTRVFDLARIVPEGGRPFVVWIGRATHLMDRVVEQQAEETSVTRFSDYRWVDGIRLPFTIRLGNGDPEHEDVETVETVQVNPEIPDTRFALPSLPRSSTAGPESVTIPFRLENNQIIVDVSLNGKGPYEADFDSGGSLLLPPEVVTELGVAARGTSRQTGGGEGAILGSKGILDALSLGGATLNNSHFVSFAWDDEHPKRLLIGLEVLQQFAVRIDFDAMTMTLTRLESFKYTGDGAVLPFHFQDNQPEVYGAVDGISGVFAVDTGDNGSLLLIAPFAHRYDFAGRYHATIPYGGTAVTATHGVMTRVHTVTLDGPDGRPVASVDKPITRISLQQSGFDADQYVSGNLGLGILKQFNITFDYRRQRLILAVNHFHGMPDLFDRSGMHLTEQKGAWTVDDVYSGGPAEQVGIRPGDVILTVNGKGSATLDRLGLRTLMTNSVGTQLQLLVRSGTTDHEVTLVLQDVL